MARWKSRTLTEGELDFMRILWGGDGMTPDEIIASLAEQGRQLTGGTVRNVLALMMEKGYVSRSKKGKTHLYRAVVDEDRALREMTHDLLDRVFGGSESMMVASLLKNRDIDPAEIERIKHLIEDSGEEDKS